MNELNVGTRIAELRNTNKLTQIELAEKLGVTDRAVSKWETGTGYPDITLLPQLADVFNVSIDYLLRGTSQVRQKIAVFNAWHNNSYESINTNYLDNGWEVVELKLTGDGGGGCLGSVVLQKEFYSES
ncbi:MAG: helix-turn-helix transcriptional regulator [Ruminococcaceae bacterium]|nr:helix-turn-helix transcriptional regulator [Oscillospiraceae bacterium]